MRQATVVFFALVSLLLFSPTLAAADTGSSGAQASTQSQPQTSSDKECPAPDKTDQYLGADSPLYKLVIGNPGYTITNLSRRPCTQTCASGGTVKGMCVAEDKCQANQTCEGKAPQLPDTSVETNTGSTPTAGTPTVTSDTKNLTPQEQINQDFQTTAAPQSTGNLTQQQLLQSAQGKSLLDQLISPTPLSAQSDIQKTTDFNANDFLSSQQYNLDNASQLPSDIRSGAFAQPFGDVSNQERLNAAETFAQIGGSTNSATAQTVTAAPGTSDQAWTDQLSTLAKNADAYGCAPSCFIVNDAQNKTAQLLPSSSGSFTGAAVVNVDPNAVGALSWQSVVTGQADTQAIADSLQKGVDVSMPDGTVQKYQFTPETAQAVAPAIAQASNNDSSNIVGRAIAAWNGTPPVSVASADQIQVQSADVVPANEIADAQSVLPAAATQAPPVNVTPAPADNAVPPSQDLAQSAPPETEVSAPAPAPAPAPQQDLGSRGLGSNGSEVSAPPDSGAQQGGGNLNAGGSGAGPGLGSGGQSSGSAGSSYSNGAGPALSFITGILSGLGGAGSAPQSYGVLPVFVSPVTLNIALAQPQASVQPAQPNVNAQNTPAQQTAPSAAIVPYFVPPAGTTHPSSAYDPLTQLLQLAEANPSAPSSAAPSAGNTVATQVVPPQNQNAGSPPPSGASAPPTAQSSSPQPAQSESAVPPVPSGAASAQPGTQAPSGNANAGGTKRAPSTPASAGGLSETTPQQNGGTGGAGAGTGTGNGIGSGSQSGVQTFANGATTPESCQTVSCWGISALKTTGKVLLGLVGISPANAQPYDPHSGQALADAVNISCKVYQCNAQLLQQAFGGVCGIESGCNAMLPHRGSQYQGFGQLGTRETYTAINQLAQMQQSPNLSAADKNQLGQVVTAATQMVRQGINPNTNPVVGPWLLVGLHASLGTLRSVSAATNDPRMASAMLECAQFAPATCSHNFNLNSRLGFASAQAFNVQHLGWYRPGMTVGQASQELYTAASGKFNTGINFASRFTPGGTPAPIPANYALGNCAYRGCGATPTVAVGKPGYASGIERVAQCPNMGLCYSDPQTGAFGAPSVAGMTREDFVRAAREDVVLERMAQAGTLPQGAGFQNFTATPVTPLPVNVSTDSGQTQIASELAAATGISQSDAAKAVAKNAQEAINAVNAMSQNNPDATKKALSALGLDPNLTVNAGALRKAMTQDNNLSTNGNQTYTIKDQNGDTVASNVPLPQDAVGKDGAVRLLADKNGKLLGTDGKSVGDGEQPLASANPTLPQGNLDPTNGQKLIFPDTRPLQPIPQQPLFSARPIGYPTGNTGMYGQQQYCLIGGQMMYSVPCGAARQPLLQPAQIGQPAQPGYPQSAAAPGMPIPPTPLPLPAPNTNPSSPVLRPALALIASPTSVASGTPSRISWSSTGTWSCSVFAPGKILIGTTTQGSALSMPLATTSVFTALCLAQSSTTIAASTTVTIQ